MSNNRNPQVWTGPVIRFIKDNLPVLDPGGEEWDHMCITAYQFGCEALAALGQAEETRRGARPLARPHLPEVLPRWDDICVTVLSLANQRGLLSYRLPDGRESAEAATWWGRCEGAVRPPPNILASHGLGPAHTSPEVVRLLEALSLIRGRHWTPAAEVVLWRKGPREWDLDITANSRFHAALERAITGMPADIRNELDRLVTFTEEDVTEGLIRRETHQAELRAEHGADRVICQPLARESVKQGLVFLRIHDLDWLFFSTWRLPEGWLSRSERKQAIEIFHDSLAIQMRKAVVARLYPDRPEFAG